LVIGLADQSVERRVVEYFPPLSEVVAPRLDSFIVGIDPFARNRRGRLVIIRTNFKTIADVFESGRATTGCTQKRNENRA
jgi:hypothetical protein